MPEPTQTQTPQDTSQAPGWLSDAPGDVNDIFNEPADSPAAAPQAPAAPAPADEPFLKAGTGTVYKTREDAVQGLEAKDRTIEKLRSEFLARNGFDPITGHQAPRQQPQAAPPSYMADPARFYQDLATAVDEKNPQRYMEAQLRLTQEAVAPYQQIIADMAQDRALSGLQEPARKFVGTDDFNRLIDEWPLMKQAIAGARQDIRLMPQLRDLYQIVYDRHQVRNLPQLLESQRAANPGNPPAQGRPTLSPSTATPPQTQAAKPTMATSAGRKEIIRQWEEKGLDPSL